MNCPTEVESVGEPGQSRVEARTAQRSSHLERKEGTERKMAQGRGWKVRQRCRARTRRSASERTRRARGGTRRQQQKTVWGAPEALCQAPAGPNGRRYTHRPGRKERCSRLDIDATRSSRRARRCGQTSQCAVERPNGQLTRADRGERNDERERRDMVMVVMVVMVVLVMLVVIVAALIGGATDRRCNF